MKKIWNEFVDFIMTGNVLMLAVAFIMGGLTKKVVDDFVAYIINPLLGMVVGKPEFSNTLKIGKGVFQYGAFFNTLINLVMTGAVLFVIVKAYDAYMARRTAAAEDPDAPSEEIVLLRRIADSLDRQAS